MTVFHPANRQTIEISFQPLAGWKKYEAHRDINMEMLWRFVNFKPEFGIIKASVPAFTSESRDYY
jgi:hypothetical protein